jgi:hypothetical protein
VWVVFYIDLDFEFASKKFQTLFSLLFKMSDAQPVARAEQAQELLAKKPNHKELLKQQFGKDYDQLSPEEKEIAIGDVN